MKQKVLAITIGVTGHRDILNEDKDSLAKRFTSLIQSLEVKHPSLHFRIETGLASGADLLIAKTCIKLMKAGKPIIPIGILPMPINEFRKDFSDESLTEFNELIKAMEDNNLSIVTLPDQEKRSKCYEQLGQYLINKSDILISIWDGVYKSDKGGTCDVTLRALNPLASFSDNNEELMNKQLNAYLYAEDGTPIYRLYAKRLSRKHEDDANTQDGYIKNYKNNTLSIDTSEVDNRFEHLDSISKELTAINSLPQDKKKGYLCSDDSYQKYIKKNSDLKNIAKMFGLFDVLAVKLKRKTDIAQLGLVIATALLTALFLTYAKLYPKPIMLAAYLAFFTISFIFYKLINPNKIKQSFTFARATAESLRIEFFWRAKGIIDGIGDISISKHINGQGINEVKSLTAIVNQSTLLGEGTTQDGFKETNSVLNDWIIDQKNYYKTQRRLHHRRHERYEKFINLTIAVPIILCVTLLLFYYNIKVINIGDISLKNIMVFLVGLIPMLGAVCELHSNNNSVKELYAQYDTSEKYLEKLQSLIEESSLSGSFSCHMTMKAYEIAGIELSKEHIQWMITARQKSVAPAHGG